MTSRKTQRQRLLDLFLAHTDCWIPLPSILELRISQYGTRLKELRELGFRIINRKEHKDGVCSSWFKLELGSPAASATLRSEMTPAGIPAQTSLPMIVPAQVYRDPEEQGAR